MKMHFEEINQLKETWSNIIPRWGCNIESCRAIIQFLKDIKISSKQFYNKLLKNDIVREGPNDNGYIRDYYHMLELFGLSEFSYNRTFKFTGGEIVSLLDGYVPVKGMCKTKSRKHFFLINGYEHYDNKIYFTVIDPMARDTYINPENWKLFNFIDGKIKYTGRKLDRIEWFI